MCPNMNMVHTLSLHDKNYQRYFIESEGENHNL